MGTSKSSSGSPSSVPIVPPWVSQNLSNPNNASSDASAPKAGQWPFEQPLIPGAYPPLNPKLNTPSPIAPEGRFRAARSQLGRFARSGDSEYLKRGVGGYTKSGLGGKKQAIRRFAGTAHTAGALYGALSLLSSTPSGQQGQLLDRMVLAGKSAEDVISAIVDATRPMDGTQDAESNRASLNDALVELLEAQPEADLFNLTDLQKELVIERFIACDIFRRFILDVGNAIRSKASSATIAASRLKEVKDYVREVVSASFRKLKESGKTLGQANVVTIVRSLLEDSFGVFEEYIK
ncbi:MAG: hypothetical protein KDD48_02800 [Bdellovibrionales bacterium]|nr:hypothetical protein [Bdellovibrionales bacterium]